MTEIWIDAQLSPAFAAWINRKYDTIEAKSVRALGLRDATDEEIFQAARTASVVVMSKDRDFLNLVDLHGPPPKIIWVTCGNTLECKNAQDFAGESCSSFEHARRR